MPNKIKLGSLNEKDTFSLSMFLLYKLKDVPKYSTLCELPYLLEKDDLLKLCRYYGGKTLTIPTTEELMDMLRTLLLYQYRMKDCRSMKESVELSGYRGDPKGATGLLKKIDGLLDKYDFRSKDTYE